ncbi:MAG TPA: hypothetical protein VGO00_13720 [Kofleriaceae bacterium]|nr:hypothetical protein [Kofleriaceae bacterium]
MTDIADAARITRLGLALNLRDAAVQPVLAAVAASKSADVLVGASAHGRRLDIVMPFHPDALAAVSTSTVTPSAQSKLRLRVDGDRVAAAITTPGAIEPAAAVAELSPEPFREAWLDLVEQFCSVAGGRIIARTRFVDEPRGAIEIRYGARPRAADLELAMAIDQLAGDIDVSAAQRRLWMRIHPDLGLGREIAVTTGMAVGGVSSHLGITYPITDWSLAVRVARGLTLDDGEAAKVPRQLGELAGILDSERLTSLELVLGPNEPPDLLLWTKL